MNAKDLRTAEHGGDDAGNGAGIAVRGIREVENLADDCLAGNRDEHGTVEFFHAPEFAKYPEIILALLREIDAGV